MKQHLSIYIKTKNNDIYNLYIVIKVLFGFNTTESVWHINYKRSSHKRTNTCTHTHAKHS